MVLICLHHEPRSTLSGQFHPAAFSATRNSSTTEAPTRQPQCRSKSRRTSSVSEVPVTTSEVQKPPTGFQHSERFAEHLRLIRGKVDDAVGNDHVHAGVSQRQVFNLAHAKLDVDVDAFLGCAPGHEEHVAGHIHTDYRARCANCRRHNETIETGSASQIENDVAGLKFGRGNRVATAEAQV